MGDAGLAQRDLADQTLKAVAASHLGAGAAEIAVDDLDPLDRPTSSYRAVAQGILALGALAVLDHLAQRRLPDVEISIAPDARL